MRKMYSKIIYFLKEYKRFFITLIVVILVSQFATGITYISSLFIIKNFGEPTVVKDLLWLIIPHFKSLGICEVCMALSFIYLAYYSFKGNKYLFFYGVFVISIFHVVRAIIIPLTPLGFPYAYDGWLKSGTNSVFMYGAFPSGHLSVPYMVYRITNSKIVLILTFLTGFFLLSSRGHYTIDLLGTLLIGYFVFNFSEKYFFKYFDGEKKYDETNQ